MGHYDLNCIMIRTGGVFSGTTKGVRQETIEKDFEEVFGFKPKDYLQLDREDKLPKEFNLHAGCMHELRAFIGGEYVGRGQKGDVFSYAQIANYRELNQMVDDWIEITKKMPNTFPPVILFAQCEDGRGEGWRVVYNGKDLGAQNMWDSYGLLDRV